MDYWRGGTFDDYRAYVDACVRATVVALLEARPFDGDMTTIVDSIVTLTAFAQLAPDGGTPSTSAHIHLWGTGHLLKRATALASLSKLDLLAHLTAPTVS